MRKVYRRCSLFKVFQTKMVNLTILKTQLAKLPVNEHNGTQFYVHMFTVAPDLRSFFKAENLKVEDIPTNDRFRKQGQRLLGSIHILVEIAGNRPVFDAYMKDFMDKHKRFKGLDYDLYVAFFGVWYGYVEKMIGLSPEEKAAWEDFKTELFLPAVKQFQTGWNIV